MAVKNILSLAAMKNGQSGIVKEVVGGGGLLRRLSALGLRIGKRITKQSSMLLRGPVTVSIGSTTVGLGHGMASKILIDVSEKLKEHS